MHVFCPNCCKTIAEVRHNGTYVALRGGFKLTEEGFLYQMCHRCGEEFLIEHDGKGTYTLTSLTVKMIVE